ncbi:MAG: Nramp family divalent metal transporter [Planctomycetia bacterium]|nr:Nramp family divalent metal transporter [Planctomycetia bacterium]
MSGDTSSKPAPGPTVAGGLLAPWHVGQLPPPPASGWRVWVGLLGPGVVLAGTSIGSGEWLFGPAVSAQYGGTVLWLASISIILQVFCNLMMMRYTVYCGEPIIVGGLRTRPGPAFWIGAYLILDISSIWPYNASNAAVPLAAAILGHLPGESSLQIAGHLMTESQLVRGLGFAIFILAFVPLIFGGTVYRMLEKIMSLKLVLVLGYLTFMALFMVSPRVGWEVFSGFFRFGDYPQRADTILVDRHFALTVHEQDNTYVIKGTKEPTGPIIGEFRINGVAQPKVLSDDLKPKRDTLVVQAEGMLHSDEFYFETRTESGTVLSGHGTVNNGWQPTEFAITAVSGERRTYARLEDVPLEFRRTLEELIIHQGVEHKSLWGYFRQYGRLPELDWFTLVAFAAIAGSGGLANTLFSNYTRDKGWGMGAAVGAIPSAIGGLPISLSHVGEVFPIDPPNLNRWKGWIRHIVRDQTAIWMMASFIGMALPCMLSLEFIRNATVAGDRVAAMTAEGIATRYPQYGGLFWTLTLLCGFLVLAPGQISVGDQIARRWTDIAWTASSRLKRMGGTHVKYVYYSILGVYAFWGLFVLWRLPALDIAKIGAVLGNVALGFSALHALYANRALLPKELQPHWLLQIGVVLCGIFFIGISVVVIVDVVNTLKLF